MANFTINASLFDRGMHGAHPSQLSRNAHLCTVSGASYCNSASISLDQARKDVLTQVLLPIDLTRNPPHIDLEVAVFQPDSAKFKISGECSRTFRCDLGAKNISHASISVPYR